MSNKSLQKQIEFQLSWADVKSMPDEHIALFTLVSFAATETNVLSRLYVQSSHSKNSEQAINVAIIAQQYTILRAWSAKLFEFSEMLADLRKRNTVSDPVAKEIVYRSVKSFEAVRQAKGYSVARAVRHEAANHYSFSSAIKNIPHVPDEANCNMYPNALEGNSHYPIGEEVMFMGRLNRLGASAKTTGDKMKLLDLWHGWNVSAQDWLRSTHVEIFGGLVAPRFKGRRAVEKLYWLDPALVANLVPPRIPVFLRDNTSEFSRQDRPSS